MDLQRKLRNMYFTRDCDDEIQEALATLVDSPESNDTGRMLVVVGETHVGKSSVIARALEREPGLPRVKLDGEMPVVRVNLLTFVSKIQLGREILTAIGYPLAGAMGEGPLWERVRQQLSLRKVRVLWIDEAQYMTSMPKDGKYDEKRYIENTTNIFKYVMKSERPISVILSGLPELKEHVEKDAQVRDMSVFVSIDLMNKNDLKYLWETTGELAAEIDIRIGELDQDESMPRLMHAACYVWGYALRIIVGALMEAAAPVGKIDSSPEPDAELRIGHFAAFFGKTTGNILAGNPFYGDNWVNVDCTVMLQREKPQREAPKP